MLARINRVEKIGEGSRGRTSYELDAMEEATSKTPMAKLAAAGEIEGFAIVRVVTTERRFTEVLGLEPEEGDWIVFETASPFAGRDRPDRLLAWQAQLTETGYTAQSRGYVVGAEFLYREGEPLPATLSARAPKASTASRAKGILPFPPTAIVPARKIRAILGGFLGVECVRVRDVGQASFATLISPKGTPLAHFDAGWPLSFNGSGAPLRFPRGLGHVAPVILSHWDWDHLHAYHGVPALRDRCWISPVQNLGPGQSLIAHALLSKGLLKGFSGTVNLGWGVLGSCSGPPGNYNQTGLALRVELTGGHNVLLVGDADYDLTPPSVRAAPLDCLVVTHHGADFDGNVPPPASPGARAVISCGRRNVYRHPRKAAVTRHTRAGWRVQRTDEIGRIKRGDRWLV